MRFWWVNHKQTFNAEVRGQYIWCPKRKQNGARNHFYETLREVQRGDLVFSFADAHLQAVGIAKLPCYSCPRPDEFGRVGKAWNDRGFISFDDDGVALVSPVADPESLPRMGVALDRRLFTGPFNPEQRRFLEYHRKEIFLKSAA